MDVDVLDNTHIFHVGSLSLTDQPARDTTFYSVKRAKNKGSVISYDPFLTIPITVHLCGRMKRPRRGI